MFLESGDSIRTAITRLTDEHVDDRPLLVAVAFWGMGAETMLNERHNYKLICNLRTGGTNPEIIRMLRSRNHCEVRQLDRLHAKVFIGSTGAVVSSSNFSTNGLLLEGADADAWFEAGIAITSTESVYGETVDWFWNLWMQAEMITNEDLDHASDKWRRKQTAFGKGNAGGATIESSDDISETVPTLSHVELFKSRMADKHQIYMASGSLQRIYEETVGPTATHEIKIPAYAANLLWTFSGQEIETKIKPTYMFYSPEDVLSRSETQDKSFPTKTVDFVALLAQREDVSAAIRYWAERFLREYEPDA